MKNMYRVTRPAWAAMEKMETAIILVASIMVGAYGAWGQHIATKLPAWIQDSWPIIDLVLVTVGCLLLIRIYQRHRVGCYPATFIYCFNMPEASNPSGKSQVVGYCHIKPEMDDGEVVAKGASFFWESGFLDPERAGFTSSVVQGAEEEDEMICRIRFNINSEDAHKRLYQQGVLEFQLVKEIPFKLAVDCYVSHLHSLQGDFEVQAVEVTARGYAEWFAKGCRSEKEIRDVLEENAAMLFTKLEAMEHATPPPTLWKFEPPFKENKWGVRIPTPQSIILNNKNRKHILSYLNKVLSLFGLDEIAIERFHARALQSAKRNRGNRLVAFERELKAGLIGSVLAHREDKALSERAKIIYNEIKDYFTGESLLDIGCGNGMISSLAKGDFKKLQLLDVVEYVPEALKLPFKLYVEGDVLPVDEQFDTVPVLTVLHHASEPVELLKKAWKATKKRLIIIESVVGVHELPRPVRYELLSFPDEDQIAFAAFVDWFYNRVLHNDVPVPYNFTTVENWQSVFSQNGMRLINTVHFGQDIEIGPEYHVMFVLEKA